MTVKRYEMNHKGLPEDDANGSFVLWEDYAELQRQLTAYEATVTNLTAQVQGLAAENADLKHPGTYLPSKRETPRTDAALAEIRAQGVEMFVSALQKHVDDGDFDGDEISVITGAIDAGGELAEQLRKEQGK